MPLHTPNAVWAKRRNAPKWKSNELSEFSRILPAIVCEKYLTLESFSHLLLVWNITFLVKGYFHYPPTYILMFKWVQFLLPELRRWKHLLSARLCELLVPPKHPVVDYVMEAPFHLHGHLLQLLEWALIPAASTSSSLEEGTQQMSRSPMNCCSLLFLFLKS